MEKNESNYNLIDWWKKVVLKNYANFEGRARRSEYWYYLLGNILLLVPLYAIGIGGMFSESTALSSLGIGLYVIVALGTFIPSLAVGVRRLHDLNKSGWYYLFGFIPLVGGIILLVWFCTEGDKFPNQYGDDPKNPGTPEFDFEKQTI